MFTDWVFWTGMIFLCLTKIYDRNIVSEIKAAMLIDGYSRTSVAI
jgi:hypothetical protein